MRKIIFILCLCFAFNAYSQDYSNFTKKEKEQLKAQYDEKEKALIKYKAELQEKIKDIENAILKAKEKSDSIASDISAME